MRNLNKLIAVVIIIASILTLSACTASKSEQDIAKDTLSNGGILPLMIQGYLDGNVETQQSSETVWTVLANVDTYKEKGFRANFDTIFNINTVTINENGEKVNSKQGCIYNTLLEDGTEHQIGNSCLRNAFRNKVFCQYWDSPDVVKQLGDNIVNVYADVANTSDMVGRASLNAYFNLMSFSDKDIYYNATQVLTREQFYTLMYKAGHPVTELTFDPNGVYGMNVRGSDYYNKYAEQVADYGWLSIDNGSLNKDNISRVITKLEAIYLVTNYYFSDYIERVTYNQDSIALGYRNAGNLAEVIGATGVKSNKAWQLNVLAYSISYPNDGLDENIFKVLLTAQLLGITDGIENNILGAVSKDEAIKLLINTYRAENNVREYLTTQEYAKMDIWVEPEPEPEPLPERFRWRDSASEEDIEEFNEYFEQLPDKFSYDKLVKDEEPAILGKFTDNIATYVFIKAITEEGHNIVEYSNISNESELTFLYDTYADNILELNLIKNGEIASTQYFMYKLDDDYLHMMLISHNDEDESYNLEKKQIVSLYKIVEEEPVEVIEEENLE